MRQAGRLKQRYDYDAHTNPIVPKWQRAALRYWLLGSMVQTAFAAVINVSAQDNLNDALARAQAGDTLKLASGTYRTKLYIDKPITIEGPADRSAKIVGDRSGRTVAVHAPDVTLRNLTVSHSGMSLPAMDAGIYLEETATRALVEHNNIIDNSVGVYIHGAAESMVRENKIIGDATLRVNERGNGVTVWNAPGAQVVDNDISKGRDGIFSNTSTHNTYKGNRFSDLRFAVHYMYTNDSEVSNNISVGNNMGYVLMFSERLKVYGNIAVGSRDQGIMLNYVNYSEIHDNVINKAGKMRCLPTMPTTIKSLPIISRTAKSVSTSPQPSKAQLCTKIHLLITKARLNMSAPASSIGARVVAATIGAITVPLTLTATASATVPTVPTGLSTKSSGAHPSPGY